MTLFWLCWCIVLIGLTLPSAIDWRRPPPIPALWPQRAAVFELLRSLGEIRVVEVGSGTYPLLVRWPGPAIGIELSWLAWVMGRITGFLVGSQMRMVRGNALHGIPTAEGYVLYLGDGLTQTVAKRLPAGAFVVSVAFPVHAWSPMQRVDTHLGPVFLYQRPDSLA